MNQQRIIMSTSIYLLTTDSLAVCVRKEGKWMCNTQTYTRTHAQAQSHTYLIYHLGGYKTCVSFTVGTLCVCVLWLLLDSGWLLCILSCYFDFIRVRNCAYICVCVNGWSLCDGIEKFLVAHAHGYHHRWIELDCINGIICVFFRTCLSVCEHSHLLI